MTVADFSITGTSNVTAASSINVAYHIMLIEGDGGAIDITADPQVADPGVDGSEVIFVGLSDVNTVQFDDGTGLQLAAGASCVLGAGDVLALIYIDALSVWVEKYRSNN